MADQAVSPGPPTHKLNKDSVSLNLFVGIFRLENPNLLDVVFDKHIAWVAEREAEGRIFLGGPLTPQGGEDEATGLTVYQADSLAEADVLAQADPFVSEGVMSVQVRPWTVVGGSISFALRLSNSSVVIR